MCLGTLLEVVFGFLLVGKGSMPQPSCSLGDTTQLELPSLTMTGPKIYNDAMFGTYIIVYYIWPFIVNEAKSNRVVPSLDLDVCAILWFLLTTWCNFPCIIFFISHLVSFAKKWDIDDVTVHHKKEKESPAKVLHWKQRSARILQILRWFLSKP